MKILINIEENGSSAQVRVFNLAGELVRDLGVTTCDQGLATIIWDLLDDHSIKVKSSTYIASVIINNRKPIIKQIIIIR